MIGLNVRTYFGSHNHEGNIIPFQRDFAVPSKHETMAQCWVNVFPASTTLAQH